VAHAQPPPGPLTEGLARVTDAVSLAEEAVALAPRSARAHTTLAVASGRLALYTPDARSRVALATRIRLAAEQALALDPAEDVAHHALGRWHFEIASLNPITRLFARTILGGADMARASHAQALRHYAAAAELAPRRLTHRAEMGKALLKLGRRAEALQALRAALACEVEDINALLGRMHAERLIKKLRRQERREQREALKCDTALAARIACFHARLTRHRALQGLCAGCQGGEARACGGGQGGGQGGCAGFKSVACRPAGAGARPPARPGSTAPGSPPGAPRPALPGAAPGTLARWPARTPPAATTTRTSRRT
jgi:hypothetical protein